MSREFLDHLMTFCRVKKDCATPSCLLTENKVFSGKFPTESFG
jgi:hypothetical protein